MPPTAMRMNSNPESCMPVYMAPNRHTPTSDTRARSQYTYHMVSANTNASVTYSNPTIPRK